MTLFSLAAFAVAMAALAATPGPGVFATVGRALASGFQHAAVVVLGIVIGDLIFLMFAVYGLATVAQWMGDLFTVVRYVGAAYLIWLGLTLWRSNPANTAVAAIAEPAWSQNLISGLLITLSNPKVILFYLGFLPAFVDLTRLNGLDIVLLAAVVALVLGGTLLAYAYAAANARELLRDSSATRLLNRIAGSLMIITGGVVATRG
ncbi:MAG: LysE family translocator [Sedimenticolaceae bacterium]